MTWGIVGRQYIPAQIGEPWGGGYFAGYISHTANGNPTHALIVAPRATGATGTGYTLTTNLAWKTTNTDTAGTNSTFDGAANTAAIVTAGITNHPAAQFCVNLNIGGFTDWYLPARHELDIAYFNLKPNTVGNSTPNNADGSVPGVNPYSVPRRDNVWTSSFPSRTNVSTFQSTEAFAAGSPLHWPSNQLDTTRVTNFRFNDGLFSFDNKTALMLVRAFRRIAI
jgi:hypothetical protein